MGPMDELAGCVPGGVSNALLDPLFMIGVVGVGRLTLVRDARVAQARFSRLQNPSMVLVWISPSANRSE